MEKAPDPNSPLSLDLQLAHALNVDLDKYDVIGGQDWRPDTHSHLICSEFKLRDKATGEEVKIPFRIRHAKLGKVFTKLTHEAGEKAVLLHKGKPTFTKHEVDHIAVESHYQRARDLNQFKNGVVQKAIHEAVPDIDGMAETTVKIEMGGKQKIADLIDGKIQNIRDIPPMPTFHVDEDDDDKLGVDLTELELDHQAAAHAAIKHHPQVVVKTSPGTVTEPEG